LLAGCADGYVVRVNGFLEADRAIADKAAIYVAEDANSRNPIFMKEIKAKVERLLSEYGYSPSAEENVADYRLSLAFGVDRRQVSGFQPYYGPVWFGHYGHGGQYYGSFGTYVPYTETYHDQWLTISLADTGRQDPLTKGTVVWVGEALTTKYNADMRQTINYLLVAVFEFFGQDTRKQRRIRIDENDPRLMHITADDY
jgi:hypothetical protein